MKFYFNVFTHNTLDLRHPLFHSIRDRFGFRLEGILTLAS
jgi:hypothetical protein